MPELPEVETFKRYLDNTSLHQRISTVEVRAAYVLKRVSARELVRRLKGRRFENSHRHGKHLLVRAGNEPHAVKRDGGSGETLNFSVRHRPT